MLGGESQAEDAERQASLLQISLGLPPCLDSDRKFCLPQKYGAQTVYMGDLSQPPLTST
jgi:hypothetical protein